MSRTRKTAPFRVKLARSNHLIPWHNHRNNECDLPPEPDGRLERKPRYLLTRCFWTLTSNGWNEAGMRVGCGFYCCNPDKGDRRERRKGKRYARGEWRKEY